MAPLTIIAKLKAKAGSEDRFYEAYRKLVAPTRAEEGCINYDMHRSIEDPGLIMFYENWETKPLWEQHMESPPPQRVLGRDRGHGRGVKAISGREGRRLAPTTWPRADISGRKSNGGVLRRRRRC